MGFRCDELFPLTISPPLALPLFAQEPELLQGEADRIRRMKQDVAVQNYRAFIIAAECTSTVRTEVASVRDRLDELQKARDACYVRV